MNEELDKKQIVLILNQLLHKRDIMFDICEMHNMTPLDLKECIHQILQDLS